MTTRQPLYKSLYVQVIVAIAIGILLGHYYRKPVLLSNRWEMALSN